MIDQDQKKGFLFFLKDKRKKNYLKILSEFLTLWVVKKEVPFYYFKYLYRKDVTNIKDYLGKKEQHKIKHSPNLHSKERMDIISNKLIFSIFCNRNKLRVSELVSYNFGSNFCFNGEVFKVSNYEELVSFYQNVFENTKHDKLFLKPFSLYGGKGACMIKKSTIALDLKDNAKDIIAQDYIHEEVLIQHEEINKIHASCVNTIRIETFIDRKEEIHILSAFMRFGIGDNVIDNLHSGGVFVPVDLEKGCLKEHGLEHIRFGGRNFSKHPESNYSFKEFKIPYFQEACKLVIEAVERLPDRYIGWDIAITENGPVIVEANEHMNVFTSDVAYGGYLKHPVFKEVMKEIV